MNQKPHEPGAGDTDWIPRITVGHSVSIPVAVGAMANRATILTTRLLVLTLMLSLMSG
jgi:hypothetical protein